MKPAAKTPVLGANPKRDVKILSGTRNGLTLKAAVATNNFSYIFLKGK